MGQLLVLLQIWLVEADFVEMACGSAKWTSTSNSHDRKSVVIFIQNRKAYGHSHRKDVFLLRKLLTSSTRKFSQVWKKCVSGSVTYDGFLYMLNFRFWFGGCFCSGVPHLLSNSLPRLNWRIEDALRFECSVTEFNDVLGLNKESYSHCVFAVTSNAYLMQYKVHSSGWQTQKRVFLSQKYFFKHLNWESDSKRFVLKSIVFSGPSTFRRTGQAALTDLGLKSPYIYFALFDAAPLEFVCLFFVTRQIFGKTIVDVNVLNDFLVVTYCKNLVKIFDFKYVLETTLQKSFRIGESVLKEDQDYFPGIEIKSTFQVGDEPLGIPVNLQISSLPPLVYQVNSCISGLSFGGYPWKCIVANDQSHNSFQIYDLATGKLTSILNCWDPDSWLSDMLNDNKAYFHADNSGRIVSVHRTGISLYQIPKESLEGSSLELCFTISCEGPDTQVLSSAPLTTRYGRSVKIPVKEGSTHYKSEIVHALDYDDEIEVLAVLYTGHSSVTGKSVYIFGLYSNEDGTVLHRAELDEIVSDADDHMWSVFIDRDVVICVMKSVASSHQSKCVLFKLQESVFC